MPSYSLIKTQNVKVANLGLRALQFLIAIPLIAIYVTVLRDKLTGFEYGVCNLGVAAASVSLVIAIVFVMTLVLSNYVWVARCFLLDLIVMALFAILFTKFKRTSAFGDAVLLGMMPKIYGINLIAMLLWLITSIMGIASLILDKLRDSKPVP